MTATEIKALTPAELVEKLKTIGGIVYWPIHCRRCNLVTGKSREKGVTVLCHSCNWAEAFEEASDPRVANAGQKRTEAAEVLTDGASVLPASSATRLPGGVHAPSVSTSEGEG
jgi:hypothetical protein